jgi:hypothetical protein
VKTVSVYHQMGHHSENLLLDSQLQKFSGAILSPVNYCEADVTCQVGRVKQRTGFETIFDPQLYYPRSERGLLRQWDYFPDDADTADMNSEIWWHNLIDKIVLTCSRVQPTAACSPVFAPRIYSNEYYKSMIQLGKYFASKVSALGIRPVQTIMCNLSDLAVASRALEVASIITQATASSTYLVFTTNLVPRRELNNTDEIKGAMHLISALERAGLPVLVGYTSSDLVAWKLAGATSCASGKFFNLRRSTSARLEEPTEGGGQLPYWFEETLMAFLRESDIIRIRNENLLSAASMSNPFAIKILDDMDNNPGQAWLGLSWRQYLYAFADLEDRIENGLINIPSLLASAERNWIHLEDKGVLMEEARNNGEWIRIWRRAVAEFKPV